MKLFESDRLALEAIVKGNVLSAIEGYCGEAEGKETGGRLVGHYPDDETVVVNHVMGPPSDSVQREQTFDTGVAGVEGWLRGHEANGLSYVGEWHSHPSAPPTPGEMDRDVMKNIANDEDYGNPNPLLFIMGGDAASGYLPSVSLAFRDDRPFTVFEEKSV